MPVAQGPRKSEHPEGGTIKITESVLVSWSVGATTPEICIHSKQVLSFASDRILMLRDASKELRLSPAMWVAAPTLVAWALSGGQLCSTTGLDPKKGFGSQLSPLWMCWIKTQQPLCGYAAGMMLCGSHCKVAAGWRGERW